MTAGAGEAAVERAREAVARGEWREAFGLLAGADAEGLLGPGDLPFLADVSYAAGEFDATIEAWERAHTAAVQAEDAVAAAGAAVRIAMHLLFDTALMAPVRGWLRRADRLLEGHEDTSAHAWLAVVRAYERILSGDLESAREWIARAIAVGEACDPAAHAVGRVAEARLRILEGDVDHGLQLLDEAGVVAVSGTLDPLSTGVVYCELVCALQGMAQYDSAEQWTEAMERWSVANAIGSVHGRCRVHRAEILRLRGLHDEAEEEALAACDELRPFLRREIGWPLTELGRIRLRKDDIEGAEEALIAARAVGWDPEPVLSLALLARGDVIGAAASVHAALDRPIRVPSKERPPNTDLSRVPLIEAQVEIDIAAGDIARAREGATELVRIADRYKSKALLAAATLARGRVRLADGEEAAENLLTESARLWDEIGAPYEASRARSLLGNGPAERIAHRVPHDLDPRPDMNEFRREGDYWKVVFAGRVALLRDVKGMRYLARLLASPGREFHVLDLAAAESEARSWVTPMGMTEPGGTSLGDAGEILDDRAKSAYRRRLEEIEDDIRDAQANGDFERAAQAEAERDFIVRELSQAVGLGGRDRRAASASERARAGVTRAIRQAMARIGNHHRKLGEHLDVAIRTGTYCGYFPDPLTPPRWTTRRDTGAEWR